MYSKRVSEVAFISKSYRQLRVSTRDRQQTNTSMIDVAFTKDAYAQWLYNNNYKALYTAWESSGFLTAVRPSPDRLNESIGYTFDNMRLVTWEENRLAHIKAISKPIESKCIITGVVTVYESISHAERITGKSSKQIRKALVERKDGTQRIHNNCTWRLV